MKKLLVLDLDTGIDDAIALIHAVRSPHAQVLAVGTVGGNIDAGQAALNTLKVLDVLGVQIPVAVGLHEGLVYTRTRSALVHGEDGLGDAGLPAPTGQPSGEHAVDQLIRLAQERPGEITLCACGPLSNVAMALKREPALAGLLKELVLMGGATEAAGNATPVAEANIRNDPEAAAIVFQATMPRTMVGLDVTMQATLTAADLRRLAATDQPVAQFVARVSQFYLARYTRMLGREVCAMHDPLAVGIAIDRDLVTRQEALDVQIETAGALTRGMTVADRRVLRGPGYPRAGNPTNVVLGADSARFMQALLASLLQ